MESRGKAWLPEMQQNQISVKKHGKGLGSTKEHMLKARPKWLNIHSEAPVSARKDFTLCLSDISPCWPDGPQDRPIHRPQLAEPVTKRNIGKMRASRVWDKEERRRRGLDWCTKNTSNHLNVPELLETRELTTRAVVFLQCQSVSSAAWCLGLWRKQIVCRSFLADSVLFGSVLHAAPQQTWSGESRWKS